MNCAAWIMKIIPICYVLFSEYFIITTLLSFTVVVKHWRESKKNWTKRINE